MSELSFNHLAVYLVAIASLTSLLLLILKGLGKEFEAVALVWLRVWKRISVERRKINAQQPQPSVQNDSKGELDSVSR
jgi:hypothetical protein